jgi:rubrerythrin
MNNLSKMMAEKKKVIICGEEFELEQMNIRELAKMAQLQQKDPTEAMLHYHSKDEQSIE